MLSFTFSIKLKTRKFKLNWKKILLNKLHYENDRSLILLKFKRMHKKKNSILINKHLQNKLQTKTLKSKVCI